MSRHGPLYVNSSPGRTGCESVCTVESGQGMTLKLTCQLRTNTRGASFSINKNCVAIARPAHIPMNTGFTKVMMFGMCSCSETVTPSGMIKHLGVP